MDDKKDREDRRRSPRLDVDAELTGHIKPTMAVKILNISEHGILIESPVGLPPAGMCEVTVKAPSGPKVIRARVARCRLKMAKQDDGFMARVYHAGLEFSEDYAGSQEIKALMLEVCILEEPAEMTTDAATSPGIEQAM